MKTVRMLFIFGRFLPILLLSCENPLQIVIRTDIQNMNTVNSDIVLFVGDVEIPHGTGEWIFEATDIGSSTSVEFTIKNNGLDTLQLTGDPFILVDGDSSFSASFTTVPPAIASGGEATFSVTFTPTSAGTQTALLSIESNDADRNPFETALIGTGRLGDVRITNTTGNAIHPQMVWTGSEYGVIYSDNTTGNHEIYFTKLSKYGEKLITDVQITNASEDSVDGRITWTGTEYGVCWYDERDTDSNIYFCRINSAGIKQGSDVKVSGAALMDVLTTSSITWNGSDSEFGIAWSYNSYEMYFARINSFGVKQGSEVNITDAGGSSYNPSLIWNGSEYGLAFTDTRDGPGEIYFARIDSAGIEVGSEVNLSSNTTSSGLPRVAWNGSEYGITWNEIISGQREVYFNRFDSSGSPQGTAIRVTINTGNSDDPTIVWTGTDYGICWTDDTPDNYEVYFSKLSSTGAVKISPKRITDAVNLSSAPNIYWSGSEFNVIWYDSRDGTDVYYARIYADTGEKM